MPKKILYISYDGMTDPLGQSQVIPYLTGLAAKGFKITIISCEKKSNFFHNKDVIKSLLDKSGISWTPVAYTRRPPVISTIFDVWKIKRKAIALHKKENFSTVHCRSYIPSLAGWMLKKKYGIKFIFDMRGFWADERVDGGLWNLKNPLFYFIYRYFKKKERKFLKNADHIVSLTYRGKQELLKLNLSNMPPVHVIPCCTDTELFSPAKINEEEKNNFKKDLNISDSDFIISYLGAIGTWYLLEEMLLFFHKLLLSKPDSKFLFITHEDPETILKKAISLQISPGKIIIRKASRKEVPGLLSICRFSVFFIKPAYSKKASSPTKMGEIMSMGIPLVCNSGIGDVDQVIFESNAGIIVNRFDEEEYKKAIDGMERFSYSPQKIRESAVKFFSLAKGIALYDKIYSD